MDPITIGFLAGASKVLLGLFGVTTAGYLGKQAYNKIYELIKRAGIAEARAMRFKQKEEQLKNDLSIMAQKVKALEESANIAVNNARRAEKAINSDSAAANQMHIQANELRSLAEEAKSKVNLENDTAKQIATRMVEHQQQANLVSQSAVEACSKANSVLIAINELTSLTQSIESNIIKSMNKAEEATSTINELTESLKLAQEAADRESKKASEDRICAQENEKAVKELTDQLDKSASSITAIMQTVVDLSEKFSVSEQEVKILNKMMSEIVDQLNKIPTDKKTIEEIHAIIDCVTRKYNKSSQPSEKDINQLTVIPNILTLFSDTRRQNNNHHTDMSRANLSK